MGVLPLVVSVVAFSWIARSFREDERLRTPALTGTPAGTPEAAD